MPPLYTVLGIAPLDVQLREARRVMQDWRPMLQESKAKYLRTVEESFRFERSAGNRYWRPLANRTMVDRVSKGFPAAHPILVRTGDLKWVATHASGMGNEISGFNRVTNRKLEMSLYGDKTKHQDGYTWKPPGQLQVWGSTDVYVPARPFWDLERWQQDEMFKPFTTWADRWLFYP